MKISIQPLGPGMVQQVQRVCPDCAGEGIHCTVTLDVSLYS